MNKEPKIVRILKEEERLGILLSSIHNSFEDSGKTKEKAEERYFQTDYIEEKYHTIFENYAVAITIVDNNERIISWNKYTEKLLNMNEKELFMRPVESLYPPDEWKKIRAENVRQKGMKYRLETKLVRKYQGFFDAELSLCVLKDNTENIVGSIGIIKDITKLKKTEKKLKESEEKFRRFYENAPVPYHTLSPYGFITDVNEKWCQILGYSKKEAIGKTIFDFIVEEERESAKLSFKDKISSKKFYVEGHERKFLTKASEERTFMINDFLSYDESNNVNSIYTIIEDITGCKKTEKEYHEKLEILNEKLEKKVQERTAEIKQLLEQKDEFINQLGHDLKTPLTPLVSLLPILEKTEGDPKSKEILEVLVRNVNYIKNLVIKTIELARLNKDSTVFDLKDLNLWEEAENAIQDQKYRWDEKGLKVKNKINENILVKADKLQLGELFYNLINNAVKYTTYGGNITIDAHSDGDFVTVSIMDSGIGINDEQIKYVFNEFYKADHSRHDFSSVGLGLSICKRIVEKHRGKIWVESPGIGKGSTFYFTLRISNKIDK